jgi:hypothetical protein
VSPILVSQRKCLYRQFSLPRIPQTVCTSHFWFLIPCHTEGRNWTPPPSMSVIEKKLQVVVPVVYETQGCHPVFWIVIELGMEKMFIVTNPSFFCDVCVCVLISSPNWYTEQPLCIYLPTHNWPPALRYAVSNVAGQVVSLLRARATMMCDVV